jgi:hypothetical protein
MGCAGGAGEESVSESVFELLRKRYPPPAWAFLEDVRNQTGYGRQVRTCDALAMSLYPSRGLHLHGFEVKVSRADWFKELQAPEKAEEIARFCHFWWLVVDDGAIVQNGELPATWGLLARHGKVLKLEKEPMFNKDAAPPNYRFLGAILRKFGATSTDAARIERVRGEGFEAGVKDQREREEKYSDFGRYKKAHEELLEMVHKFEKASGVSVSDPWTKGSIANAVRLLSGGWDSPPEALQRLAKDAKGISEKCEAALDEIRRALPAMPKDDQEV